MYCVFDAIAASSGMRLAVAGCVPVAGAEIERANVDRLGGDCEGVS